jgi:hypothetical protein
MAQFDFERDAAEIAQLFARRISNPKLAARRKTGDVAYGGGVPSAEPENDRSSNAC